MTQHHDPAGRHPADGDDHEHPILEAFNAEEVIEGPGDEDEPLGGPASDADAPAPP